MNQAKMTSGYKVPLVDYLCSLNIPSFNIKTLTGTKEFDIIKNIKLQDEYQNILPYTKRKVNMLSDKIRQVRQKKGLSQSELARRSGHAVSTIHGIENGDNQNPSFRLVCDIAKVLSIPLDELYQDMLNEK